MTSSRQISPTIRILYAGSGKFSIEPFRALVAFGKSNPAFQLVGVITQPPQPAGRGQKLTPTPLDTWLKQQSGFTMPVFRPEKLKLEADALLESTQPDLIIVCDYGQIVPEAMLTYPPYRSLNIHPSLLPKYRGAIPIPEAILHGDAKTGVSIQIMVQSMDAGPLLSQEKVPLAPDDNSATLADKLSLTAASLLPATMLAWVKGKLKQQPQDETQATYCYERDMTKDTARINWTVPADQIDRLIRACNPDPLAWTTFRSKRLIIHRALPVQDTVDTAEASSGLLTWADGRLSVNTSQGKLQLVEVQLEGKSKINAAEFVNGYPLVAAEKLV